MIKKISEDVSGNMLMSPLTSSLIFFNLIISKKQNPVNHQNQYNPDKDNLISPKFTKLHLFWHQ